MAKTKRRFTRQVRMEQILRILYRSSQRGGITTHQIAFWAQMRPSNHLRDILGTMEELGWVASIDKFHRPQITKKLYSITPDGLATLGIPQQLELPF